MNEGVRFSAGIVDFNTRRMTREEVESQAIPPEVQPYVADIRQYPVKIAEFLPPGTVWLNPDQPWYFREVLGDEEKVARLQANNILILSGSGMSVYKFKEGMSPADPPQEGDSKYLERAGKLLIECLGERKWILGDCFGGQLSMHVLGGEVSRLPNNKYGNAVTEAGYLSHRLTREGRKDEVFGHLPEEFYAAHFHSDFVAKLPIVGSRIVTQSGEIEIVRSEVLAVRNGYLDLDGLKNEEAEYIHGAVVEFDNGARLYHTQPHAEMSTPERANFFARHVEWWLSQEEQMGSDYAAKAKVVPTDADYEASKIITNFALTYMRHNGIEKIPEMEAHKLVSDVKKYARVN